MIGSKMLHTIVIMSLCNMKTNLKNNSIIIYGMFKMNMILAYNHMKKLNTGRTRLK